MKSVVKAATAVGIAGIMAVAAAAPAQADPWDGGDVTFGLGEWDYENSDVAMDDVYLITGPDSSEYTDIWDGMGYTYIDSEDANLDFAGVACEPEDSVDVTVEEATGDLLYTCTAEGTGFAEAGLVVTSEIRVYSTSDLVRVATTITNVSGADIVIDGVGFYTDFGSSGEIWGYQGQDDAILPVPAAEDSTSTDALIAAGSQWAVHYNEYDAPGGVAWGAAGAEAPASLESISGDEYSALVSSFTIPAGESRAVAYFALWNPALLIELGYTNETDSGQVEAADALVPAMAEFDTFAGRLTVGLEGVSVVNWGPVAPAPAPVPVPEPEAPKLAATGSESSAGTVGVAGLLVLLGAAALAVSLRRRNATR
ncbi:LPXTG-motif cell wall-anchored protein [Leifsonia sp. AK011]|uniref:LPXTG cell wall anchor domain-containing protein n=1 Tax=Leifsonia sp. AK011 TaxID=2723075 RepID=UPI0015C79BBF|nr:LPXTG cell wall anchor domain-containing protein [Leifsonia sp. AK011]NYF11453.1 LPXTG-motif cell wall-anchored protein [Leifsonia sp. AK011]